MKKLHLSVGLVLLVVLLLVPLQANVAGAQEEGETADQTTTGPTEEPTVKAAEEPTAEPTVEPTTEPTKEASAEPTTEPTEEASAEPTAEPTEEVTAEPTEEVTAEPTEEVTAEPTAEPTEEVTAEPTAEPTEEATAEPTAEPTEEATVEPTAEPTAEPLEVETEEVSGSGAQAGPWSTTIYISNPNDAAATGAIQFYETDGTLDATYDFSNISASGIPAHGSAAIDVASVGIADSSWQGAAVVNASAQVAVQVGLKVNSNTDRMLYSGFTQGDDKVSSPAIACKAFDQDSDLVVMNTSDTETTFTVKYLSTTGGKQPTTGPHTVKGNSSVYLDVCTEVGESSGWLGSATITAANQGDSLVAVVFQPYVSAVKAVAYEALSGDGGNTVFFPTALRDIFGPRFTSFYAIQNVGTSSTRVELKFFNSSGSKTGSTLSKTIAAGEKVGWSPIDAGIGAGFSGSAVASAGSGGQIAAITNIATSSDPTCSAGAGRTTAFLVPTDRDIDSSATLAVPWVEYKSGVNWRTFLAVQNVANNGSTSGTVTVTYYKPNGTVAATDNLGKIKDGAKGNSNPSSAGAGTNFLGSLEITSTNSGDKLVALTNNQQDAGCHASSSLGIPIQ